MKRFQPGLKRAARPQRHGGEELDWGLQITNEKSSKLWGWREKGAGLDNRGQQQRHWQHTLAYGGNFETDPQRKGRKKMWLLLLHTSGEMQRNLAIDQNQRGTV